MSVPRGILFHGARALLAPAVALVAWLAFPRAAGNLPPPLEVGAVAAADIIAPRGFVVTKTDAERAREAEVVAATVKAVVRVNAAGADSAVADAVRYFAALDSAAALARSDDEWMRIRRWSGQAYENFSLPLDALQVYTEVRLRDPGYQPTIRRAEGQLRILRDPRALPATGMTQLPAATDETPR